MACHLLDRGKVLARRHLVAAGRARQQQPEQARLVQRGQQPRRQPARVLALVGRGGDGRTQRAGAGRRVAQQLVGALDTVHALPFLG